MATLERTAATRDATADDLGALADMGVRFVEWSPYSTLGATRDGIAAGVMRLLDDAGFVRVLEVDGRVVGMFLGALSPLWFDASIVVASELAWWVEPEHRNGTGSLRLLRDFEAWAKQAGVRALAGSDLDQPGVKPAAGPIFEGLGYRAVERSWMKEVR